MRWLILSLGLLILCAGLILSFKLSRSPEPVRLNRHFFPQLPLPRPYSPITPSIDDIFSNRHSWTATLSAEKTTTLIATGDVIPARVANIKATRYNDFLWSFRKTADFLKTADITLINLETPLLRTCPEQSEGFKFCGNAAHVSGLKHAGVDIASFANNHLGNFGLEGIMETKEHLETAGISVFGIAGPVYKTNGDTTFAFLSYNDIGASQEGISFAEEARITEEVQLAKQNSDVVIVEFHWGTEYRALPDQRQIDLGRLAIDSGADLVIGNHPHWIQPIEIYRGKLITYAHGNFVFDQEWSEKTKLGVVGKYTFFGKTLVDVEYRPIKIVDYGQPYFLDGLEKDAVLEVMRLNSQKLGKVLVAVGDIACGPLDAGKSCQDSATAKLAQVLNPDAVLVLGDLQYQNGALADFQQYYHRSWGKLKAITYPVPGNHEYQTEGAAGYFDYFQNFYQDRNKDYYSFNLGNWHLIALNSNCWAVAGCRENSPQGQWLKQDLDSHRTKCTLAFWHHPYFTSGRGDNYSVYRDFWELLYKADAELVLNGHEHLYERFDPQNSRGDPDLDRGIREFVVGTGGINLYSFHDIKPNSAVRNNTSFGVLKLTLNPDRYDWEFISVDGAFSDSGSGGCR